MFLRVWFVVFVTLFMGLSILVVLGFNTLLLWSLLLVFLPAIMIQRYSFTLLMVKLFFMLMI
jgi:hypothetical protein